MTNPNMNLRIDLDGDIIFCTLQEFADANADDMPANADTIAAHLLTHDDFVCGGGAMPTCTISHA